MNCLTYALGKFITEGGYIIMRKSTLASHFGLKSKLHPMQYVPHFLHRDREHNITQYVPTDEQRAKFLEEGLWRTYLLIWSFEGKITGDDPINL